MSPVETDQSSESTVVVPRGHELIKSVLIIDRPEVTSVLGRLIESCGWRAIEAANPGQARGLVARYKPDFILSEVVLPGENGFEYCAFQKKLNCRIPFVLLSNVRLTAARNLAIWAGADAYLSKPIGGRELYKAILVIANRVSFRISQAEKKMSGSIRFKCSCGRRLEVGLQNAGRVSICPSCRHMVRCPESAIDYGLLFEELRKEDRKSSIGAAGVICKSCRKTVSPSECRVRNSYKCTECGSDIPMTREAADRWELFFRDSNEEPAVTEFDPLAFVYVRCEKCKTFHKYFSAQEKATPCPGCSHVQSLPSVTGASLSRAALNSTGRLFEISVRGRKKNIFLAPAEKNIAVGSDRRCHVRIQEEEIETIHCTIAVGSDSVSIKPRTPETTLRRKKKQLSGTTGLEPGDTIWLSRSVTLRLCGNNAEDSRELISEIQRTFQDSDELAGSVQFNQPGADVIQLYWEQQRRKWFDYRRRMTPFTIEFGESVFDFPTNKAIAIGRGIDCDVRLFEDPGVERVHCVIIHDAHVVTITDNDSRGGTWVSGRRIVTTDVSEGEEVRVGDTIFRIKRRAMAIPAKPR